jgi:hypothetical protein
VTELLDYAKNEFFLNSIVKGSKNGTSQRKHLEQIAKVTRVEPPELQRSARVPEALHYLWKWYENELIWNSPVTFQEIDAWSRLMLRPVTSIEVEILLTLDKLHRQS